MRTFESAPHNLLLVLQGYGGVDPAQARLWDALLLDPPPGQHVGLVYRDERFLARAVARWCATSLRQGGGAILVGTPVHAELVRAQLRQASIEVEEAENAGRLVFLDADWLMAQFILDGTPEARTFLRLLRGLLARVREASGGPGARVRAWGEMVSLLRMRGNAEAARRVEALWAEVIREQGLALLCTYEGGHEELQVLTAAVHDSHPYVLVESAIPASVLAANVLARVGSDGVG